VRVGAILAIILPTLPLHQVKTVLSWRERLIDLLIIPSSIVEAVDNSVDNPVLPVDNFVGIWMFPVQVLQVCPLPTHFVRKPKCETLAN
jgi:hypothetical protein